MKKWNPYILPPEKKEGGWKRAFWIAFWAILLAIFLLKNEYGINFSIGFQFYSFPETETSDDDSRQTALEKHSLEDFTVRYRD